MQSPDRICIRHKKYLESIRDDWEDVYQNNPTKSPFLSFDYVNLWYDCFAAPDHVRLYRVEDEGRPIGFLPLVLNKIMGFRVMSSLTNDHSFHRGPLACAGREDRFRELLMQGLIATQSSWDILQDSFAYSFSPFREIFPKELLIERGMKWLKRVQPTYVARVERPFDLYLRSGISPKVRKNFRPDRNRLAKAGEVRVQIFRDSEALNHWRTFVSIEASGWKGRAGSAICNLAGNYQRYYQGLIHLLARSGTLHLYFLELNRQPIAGAFCYQDGNTLHYAKTGYDERFGAFGPSNMLLLHIIEDLAVRTQEIHRFHMFPYDYGYKHRFTNEEASCTETIIYSKTLSGYAAYLLKKLKERLAILAANCRKQAPRQALASLVGNLRPWSCRNGQARLSSGC